MRKVIYVNINNNATQTVAKHLEELGKIALFGVGTNLNVRST